MALIPSHSLVSIAAFAMMMCMTILQKGCSAFSRNPIPRTSYYRALGVLFPRSKLNNSSVTSCCSNNAQQNNGVHSSSILTHHKVALENDLAVALEAARKMDRNHGLCTPPSQDAWTIVDDIYQKIQSFQDGGGSVRASTK